MLTLTPAKINIQTEEADPHMLTLSPAKINTDKEEADPHTC